MRRKSYKQKLQEGVAYESDGAKHSTITPTVAFDEFNVQLCVWGVTAYEIEEADTWEKIVKLLRSKNVPEVEIAQFLADCKSLNLQHRKKPSPAAQVTTPANDAPPTATAQAGWTLPEAMEAARRKVQNYLSDTANDPGWGALALKRFSLARKERLTEEELEQLEGMKPEHVMAKVLAPDISPAEAIVAFIRLNPRSLLNPKTSERMIAALVDLLEAAHFGTCAHRFPGLLPKENRKVAASTARRALRLLSRGETGNPPDYPPEFLANVVRRIQVAFAPIKKVWAASGNLATVRNTFGDELKDFTDKELRSRLTDRLLVAA